MAVGESPAVARHRLRFALRAAREAKGLTQREVASALEWSMAKVNRMEAGEVTISSTDLQALLHLLGVHDPASVQQLTDHARASRRRGWWDTPEFRNHLTPAIILTLQFESDATAIRSFQPKVIPGPLQTREYARSLLISPWREHLSELDVTARLEARIRRRELLINRPNPPEFLVVLDESVLLREVGGPQVVSDQLYDLLKRIRAGRVSVRVLPFTHPEGYASFGLFTIYDVHGGDISLIYREGYETDQAVLAPVDVRRHRRLFEQAWDQSLDTQTSLDLIEAQAALMRSAASKRLQRG